MLSDSLKPCPFCGHTRIEMGFYDEVNDWYVFCEKCRVGFNDLYKKDEPEIRWNTRVADEEIKRLREHKIYYDRLFEKSVVISDEEYQKDCEERASLRAERDALAQFAEARRIQINELMDELARVRDGVTVEHGNNCLCDDCMKGGYP